MAVKVKEFEKWVYEDATTPLGKDYEYSFVGLAGETGEVMEWLKKSKYRGDPRFTLEELKLELGDVLHYTTRIAIEHGWTLKELMESNIAKCTRRKKRNE